MCTVYHFLELYIYLYYLLRFSTIVAFMDPTINMNYSPFLWCINFYFSGPLLFLHLCSETRRIWNGKNLRIFWSFDTKYFPTIEIHVLWSHTGYKLGDLVMKMLEFASVKIHITWFFCISILVNFSLTQC